jgi:anti-sigma regulatory factor (Ser/Thr protein kinase)
MTFTTTRWVGLIGGVVVLDGLSPFGVVGSQAFGSAENALELALPPLASSAGIARFALTASCRTWGVPDLADAASLVLSELVTNAVVHARTPLVVLARFTAGDLTLAVADGSPSLPAVLPPDDEREGGRGMSVIESLGTTWGFQRTALGKVVWVTISTVSPA